MLTNDEFIRLSRSLRQGMVDHDIQLLDQLVTDDGVLVHHTGYRQPKEEWLQAMQTGGMNYLNMIEESIRVQNKDGRVRVIMRNRLEGKFFNMRDVWDLHVVVSFVQEEDQWKVKKVTFQPYNPEYDVPDAPVIERTEEDELIALGRRIRQAMVDQDTDIIDRIFADGATLTQQTGYKQPKEEWIDYMKTGKMIYLNATEVDIKAKIDGDTARIHMKNFVEAQIFGSRNVWNLKLTFDLQKFGDVWRVVNAVARPFITD